MKSNMTFWAILDTLLFKPLELLFEVIYTVAYRMIGNPGFTIIVLSLLMNFLVLPLYKRADAMQEEQRNTEMRLRKGVAHIKKTFRGDERMMMLQTYYRQNHYKPTYVLRGAVSLFLEIPFFIAAYRFLSGLQLLNGVSFGPIADLGKPDGLLTIAGISINLLPILMTAINLVSCVIFTKGSSVGSKVQLYGMAIFFLVFLYTSPSGLVFYWTLNNIFSLVKTVFYKIKNPGRVLGILFSAAGICLAVYGVFFYPTPTARRLLFFVCCGIALQLPLLYNLFKDKLQASFKRFGLEKANTKVFFAGGVFMAVLTGVLIPSSIIQSSPQEFMDVNYFYNPLWFIVSSFCFALGVFVIWMGVFYWLATPTVRSLFDRAIWIISGVSIVDYMFFGKNLGILTSGLKYENGLDLSWTDQLINAAVVLVVAVALCLIIWRWKKQVFQALVIGSVALSGMSVFNVAQIGTSVSAAQSQMEDNKEQTPHFSLSKSGKNVVVIMLDRAMGAYIPYIFNEKPELKEQFSGFTYYSNAVSFGMSTNIAIPALLGGYEYTPFELNKRDSETLVSKHNEALKVMPVLFDQNGYEVTVFDPTYANYQVIPDLSIYDEYPDIRSFYTRGKFSDTFLKTRLIEENKRNFFCHSIFKAVPLIFQEVLYNQGNYNQSAYLTEMNTAYAGQTMTSNTTAYGINPNFMDCYTVLTSLPDITEIREDDANTFLLMTNDTTHEPMLLQEPGYTPEQNVDNTEYDQLHADRFTVDGRTLKMETDLQISHYQVNMAAMLQLGKWFDYMRANGVYDNTRIILVSDHGRNLFHTEELEVAQGEQFIDMEGYYPLLMVKDFGSEGFVTSDEFMTNADVPTLAVNGIIENPVNPFTGKLISSDEKTAHDQYIMTSGEWNVDINNGNTFLPANWYTIHDDIWNKDNWTMVAQGAVLPAKE